ncbi:MAG: MbcA/ParS/Xre antitoxin family protein [Nevskiales bacterium]
MNTNLQGQIVPASAAAEQAVLSGAVLRAASILDLSQKTLAEILGTSPAQMTRLAQGKAQLNPADKTGELALLFVRIFRSLDAITGSDDTASRSWLQAENLDLRGVPLDLIKTVQGLVHVCAYLDSARARH